MRSLKRPRLDHSSPETDGGEGGVATAELKRGLEEFLSSQCTDLSAFAGRDVLPLRNNCDEMKNITRFMTRTLYYRD